MYWLTRGDVAAVAIPASQWLTSDALPGVCVVSLLDWVAVDDAAAVLPDPQYRVGPSDLVTLLYTSGTSGTPKGVMVSAGSFLSDINQKSYAEVWAQLDPLSLTRYPVYTRITGVFSRALRACDCAAPRDGVLYSLEPLLGPYEALGIYAQRWPRGIRVLPCWYSPAGVCTCIAS